MKRRLYFLLPDVKSARRVHHDLLLAKIDERHQHVIANDKTELEDLPEADLRQKTDIFRGVQIGIVLGGLTGMILSAVAVSLDMIVPAIEVWSVTSLTLGGAFLGAFTSSMIAVNVRNTHLKQFRHDIETGKILYMVDVRYKHIDDILDLVRGKHPEADIRGFDPNIPAFP